MHKRYILRDPITGRYYRMALGRNNHDHWTREPEEAFLFYSEEEIAKVLKREADELADVPHLEAVTVFSWRAAN